MVDFSSDVSSAGSAQYRPTHITFETPNHDPEKPTFHNGHAYAEERTHSKTDKDEEEDEDLDMLIEELESLDPDEQVEAELDTVGGPRTVPEELLQTDTRVGLVEPEVVQRRKKYGLNQMKEEKENLFLKFLGYFVGPIQFVMEVCLFLSGDLLELTLVLPGCCYPCRRSPRLGRFRRHLCIASSER
jgi:H+-transporting ATPase